LDYPIIHKELAHHYKKINHKDNAYYHAYNDVSRDRSDAHFKTPSHKIHKDTMDQFHKDFDVKRHLDKKKGEANIETSRETSKLINKVIAKHLNKEAYELDEATHVLSGDTEFMKRHAKAALDKVGAKIHSIEHDEDSGTSEYKVSHDQRDRIIHASKELEKKGKQSYGGLVTNESAELDEARGRPRKNAAPVKAKSDDEDDEHLPDRGPEPDQNIHQQLKRAADTAHDEVKGKEGYKTKGGAHVTFASGEKHFVHADHAKKVLSALDKLKPADRSKMHDHIYQSHSNFQAVHKVVS
jgi:hypothetical protein